MFDYRTKGSRRHIQAVADPLVVAAIRSLTRRRPPGAALLAYRNGRLRRDLRSDEINEYLKRLAGAEFTAKDFRTWNATVLAAVVLAGQDPPAKTKAARRRAVTAAVKQVADYLSNTPAVCRSAYIDPRVIDRFNSGETIRESLDRIVDRSDPGDFADREEIEAAVLELID
jgi:DNA topoisomerase IB